MVKKRIKKKSIGRVIAKEIRSGVPPKQAAAIAYSKAGLSKKKRKRSR